MKTHYKSVVGIVAIAATVVACSDSNGPADSIQNPQTSTLSDIAAQANNTDPLLFDVSALQLELNNLASVEPVAIDETESASEILLRVR